MLGFCTRAHRVRIILWHDDATHIRSRSKVLKSQASPFRYPFILDKESWCMLLHAVIVDLYYNSDMTRSRVDRAAPTYIVGVYACRNSLTLTLQKKIADTDQRIGTKKAWQRTRRSTTLVLFLESEHHAHRRQHSWSLNAGGLVAGALWLSMQTRRTPGLGLSFRCMRRRSVPVPDLATSSALTAQPVWIGGNRQHALCRTHCVPC